MKGEINFFGIGAVFMELTLQEKRKLIEFFEFLLDKEISKPLGEMNSEAVDNYIKILLDLQDKHVELSPEFIDEQVRKIFHREETAAPETAKTTKKHYSKNKIWLVAACVAILVALFSILSFSSERGVKDVLEDFLGTFEFIPFGEEVTKDKVSFGKEGTGKKYTSVNEFVETEKINLLCPSNNIAIIEHISIGETNNEQTIGIVFDKPDFFITITLNSAIPQEIIAVCNERVSLNGFEYYLCILEDVNQAQVYFIHDNNMYRIIHTDKDSLIEILNNMEEIKYED